jgi:hypothetical protein
MRSAGGKKKNNMKTLFGVVFLLLVGVAGLGFYLGWFHLSTYRTDQTSGVTITADQGKFRADEGKAKEKVEAFGKK